MSDAGGNHDAFAADGLSGLRGELKTTRNAGDSGYFGFFELSYETFLKLETVGNKRFNRNGKTHVCIRKRLLLAVPCECKGGIGVVQAGGKTV